MTLQANIFENDSITYTKSLYQHDKNVLLTFDGIELPNNYKVHFSNDKSGHGISVACIGTPEGVLIPNELLTTGEYVYAWVCGGSQFTETETHYTVVIPVIPRPIAVPVQIIQNIENPEIPIITDYKINPDDEDLEFMGFMNGIIENNIEEEP